MDILTISFSLSAFILGGAISYFVWNKIDSATNYSIRIGNSTVGPDVTDVFLQFDNISEGCALEGMPGGDYFENTTHVTFVLPYAYNVSYLGYHYYQVRAFAS